MLSLEGQIGVLYQEGKQVAGIYDWESHIILDSTTVDGMKVYKPHKHISARSYWLVEPVKENVFYAEFYQTMLDNLILIDAGNVAIDFPDCATLDRRLYAPINVTWISDNDH